MDKLPYWVCQRCQEHLERQFDVCWNCGTSYDGQTDPNFPASETIDSAVSRFRFSKMLIGFAWFALWIAFCIGLILAAWITDYYLPNSLADNFAGILFLFLAGLILGVTINVSGQLYWMLRQHFWPEADQSNQFPANDSENQI